jgi:hypothetical protein
MEGRTGDSLEVLRCSHKHEPVCGHVELGSEEAMAACAEAFGDQALVLLGSSRASETCCKSLSALHAAN